MQDALPQLPNTLRQHDEAKQHDRDQRVAQDSAQLAEHGTGSAPPLLSTARWDWIWIWPTLRDRLGLVWVCRAGLLISKG
ncbi:hypothetical protein [Pseudonocardia sp. TRM90224]|uniref:hypothetical protein n=1 Tax=Pseudonocardia sp. TRM90224 TaxID=2812678 RepID=UPI001E32F629|nr:hypothetical protein [Pseudonocardia sp. TRM90224]